MDQNQDTDRSEEATPFRLREARDKGMVGKSVELTSLLVMAAALALFYMKGESMFVGELAETREILASAGSVQLDIPTVMSIVGALLNDLLHLMWPLLLAVVVVAVLSTFAQTGPVFSLFPLKPDMKRLNPVQGFKRIFSKRMAYEFVKTMIKLVLMGMVMYWFIKGSMPEFMNLFNAAPEQQAAYTFSKMGALAIQLLAVLIIVVLIDVAYTRWEFSSRMRMSRRDVKDEVKRREGDPLIRSKIRELQKESAKRLGALTNVSGADVLITNPTHFAVALVYKRGEMDSPKVVAKGAGELALNMRKVAAEAGVPIMENKRLARALFKHVDIDGYVPEELFAKVAKALVWAYGVKAARHAPVATQH